MILYSFKSWLNLVSKWTFLVLIYDPELQFELLLNGFEKCALFYSQITLEIFPGISRNLEREISEWTEMFPHYRYYISTWLLPVNSFENQKSNRNKLTTIKVRREKVKLFDTIKNISGVWGLTDIPLSGYWGNNCVSQRRTAQSSYPRTRTWVSRNWTPCWIGPSHCTSSITLMWRSSVLYLPSF